MYDYEYYEDDVLDETLLILKKMAQKKDKKKGKKKYSWKHGTWNVGGPEKCFGAVDTPFFQSQGKQSLCPDELMIDVHASGFFFGLPNQEHTDKYVGVPLGTEGHIAVIGGPGSGKSDGVVKPSLRTWKGAICATDIKGELSEFYAELHRRGVVSRPYIIFDPMQLDGPGYDPFAFLKHDDERNLISNITEIAEIMIPRDPDEKQPFWTASERALLAAALLYYFRKGLSFSAAILKIAEQPTSALCCEMLQDADFYIKVLLGDIATMKDETLASIDRGLRNKIMLFAVDDHINNAFRGKGEDPNCFGWDDLDDHNVFLRIPEGRLEQWGSAIRLMITQLVRHLERRPDMHSLEGKSNVPTLLLLDEFASFGKMEAISAALATLRSKMVTICIVVQSLAQLEKFYGIHDRRIILDNCCYKAILRADDPDTQSMLSCLIGTHVSMQRNVSRHMDDDYCPTGYSEGSSEHRDFVVQPHELSALEDVLLLSPYGHFRVMKNLMHSNCISQWEQQPVLELGGTTRVLSKEEVAALESEDLVIQGTSVQVE